MVEVVSMFPRSPNAAVRISDGVQGSLMGRTLGLCDPSTVSASALISPTVAPEGFGLVWQAPCWGPLWWAETLIRIAAC